MKKIILAFTCSLLLSVGYSQLNEDQDGYILDYADTNSHCFLPFAPNHGGQMSGTGNFGEYSDMDSALTINDGLQLETISVIDPAESPAWYQLMAIYGVDANCGSLNDADKGVDMTSLSKVQVEIKADTEGAEIYFWLGGEGRWNPNSSTYDVGSGQAIVAKITIDNADEKKIYALDFSSIDNSVWTSWLGKNKIQSIGFTGGTASATFNIYRVLIGESTICFPETVSDTITFVTSDSEYISINQEVSLGFTETVLTNGCDVFYDTYYKMKYEAGEVCLKTVEDTLNIYLSSIASVADSKEDAIGTIQVYPNPVSHELTISIDNYSNLNGLELNILDGHGAVVHSEAITSATQSVDVIHWSEGIYSLQIMNGATIVDVRKIVVNN